MKTVKSEAREAGANSETASVSPLQARRPRRNVLHKNVGYHNGLLWTEEKELKKALYASLQDSKKSRYDESEEDNQNANPKRARVHAQRKFAQGSNPTSPSVTPVKFRNSVTPSMDLLPVKRPKTEDFLTFLCLRGTPILPSSLDYFNVASKNDLNCDIRCPSPVNGDNGDRQRLHTKVQGTKAAVKVRGRPQLDKLAKTQPFPKASLLGEGLESSTESSLSDIDEDLSKKQEKSKPVIFEGTRRRAFESDGRSEKSAALGRSGLISEPGTVSKEPKSPTCVQALKQKYRKQRLAKQKEAMVKAKRTDLATVSPRKDSSNAKEVAKATAEKPIRTQRPKPSSPPKAVEKPNATKVHHARAKDLARLKKVSVAGSTGALSIANVANKKPVIAKLAPNPKIATSPPADKHKPVTRHASMLLQAAREREEKKAPMQSNRPSSFQAIPRVLPPSIPPKRPVKTKTELVPLISKMEKHIPQLTGEHSYVKRLPASKEGSPKPSKFSTELPTLCQHSDFSSDDDEPLVKKQRKQLTTLGRKQGTEQKPLTALSKCLRSSTALHPAEEEMPKTAIGRPSRKTKEAATAYLELLGQKLYTQDDDFDPPARKKKTPPKMLNRKPVISLLAAKKATPGVDLLDTSTTSSSSPTSATSSPTTDATESPHAATRKWQKQATAISRPGTVKTRDFMKKLSEAQFKLAKAQGNKNRGGLEAPVLVARKRMPEPPKVRSRSGCAKSQLAPSRSGAALVAAADHNKTKVTSVVRKSAPPTVKESVALRKKPEPARQPRAVGQQWEPGRLKARKEKKRKKKKRSFKRSRQSSGSSSSSYSMPVPVKRGPGRVPAMHALRRYPTSSSDTSTTSESSSSSSTDYPSKPESTTISVRQNVPSASVAVQVNLLNDISDLDDDFWEPGFLDADIEGLFALDRVITPTLCKGASPCRLLPRSSWEPDGTPPLLKAGASTPTKRMTPTLEKADATQGSKARAGPRPLARGSPSSSPFHLKRSSPSGKRSKVESSDDDSSEFLIPLLTSSGVKDAPIFYPTTEEFQDPFQYIEKVRPVAERFGVCKIIPPPSFKPDCKVNDDMRFTAHNQYVHKMLHRWGPNVQQLAVIRKHLEDQGIEYDQPPLIGGMELDLPRLFQTVQKYGGLKDVIEKQKWQKVADSMKIGKSAQDRVTKLYDAYCKYLLPYDTLSKEEKGKLEQQLRAEKQRKKGRFADVDECITKGRSMSLSSFFRIARNTMAMWFKNDPKPTEVEQEYWRIVNQRQQHACVNAGNIDSSTYGCGFNCNKSSPFAKHQWNLKVLTNNNGSVLRCMGPVMGITIPTLHVGMLFTTGCWYRDPHCLPWIEYLHTGASKIWYGIPASQSWKFRDAMNKIVPDFCADTPIWLPSDTAMVPPNLLVENGVSLCRLVQSSGQFVVVFPRAFTSTICCGYTISESVYFSGADWLEIAPIAFKEIADSREPAVFSLQQLLFSIANDSRVSMDVLQQILPLIEEIRDKELSLRKQLYELGLKQSEHVSMLELKDVKRRWSQSPENDDLECETCRANCYISMVVNTPEKTLYCLSHAVENLQKRKKDVKCWKLLYKYDQAELNELVRRTSDQIQVHSAKKKITKKCTKSSS